MKKANVLLTLALLLEFGRATPAQSGNPAQQNAIAEALDSWISNAETHVVPIAEAMPADKYLFAPAETNGEFKGVRTFAQQVKHLAANNYWMAALILGNKASAEMYNETGPDSVRTKAEIVEYLQGSFVALHQAIATIDGKNVAELSESAIGWQKTRLSFAVDAVAHSFDHYGQLVEYLRMNGIVPPDSRPKKDESAIREEVP
jgi:DinB superfamily